MDYYSSATELEHQKNGQQKHFENNAAHLLDWPTKLRDANVWANFLWRNHPVVTTGNDSNKIEQCLPIQSSYPEMVDLLPLQLLFSCLYLIIWMAALLGNSAVLYVVTLKQVKLSSVRSVFICSLAASDILMSMTSLPITAVSIFTRDWVFPSAFCKLMGIFQGGTVFVSSFTLTAIAVDRYILIKHPTKQKIKFRTAISTVAGLWALGYACALPVGIFSSTVEYHPFCGQFCEENWPDMDVYSGRSRYRKIYGLLVLIVQFGLPMLITSLCYWQIGRLIRLQMRRRSERQVVILQESKDRMRSQKNKTNRMMATMVAGLVLAWLPMNLINLWRDFNNDSDTLDEQQQQQQIIGNNGTENMTVALFSLFFAACHSIAMTSAVWNPIIYSFFNPQFKDTIRMALEKRRQSQAAAAFIINNQQQQQQKLLQQQNSECCNDGMGNNTNNDNSRRASWRSTLLIPTNMPTMYRNSTSKTNCCNSARNSPLLMPTTPNYANRSEMFDPSRSWNVNDDDDCPDVPGHMV